MILIYFDQNPTWQALVWGGSLGLCRAVGSAPMDYWRRGRPAPSSWGRPNPSIDGVTGDCLEIVATRKSVFLICCGTTS